MPKIRRKIVTAVGEQPRGKHPRPSGRSKVHGFWGQRLHGAWLDDYILAIEHPSQIEDELALLQSLLARIISERPINVDAMQSCLDSITKLRKTKFQIDQGHRGYNSPEEYAAAVYAATQAMVAATTIPNPNDEEDLDD